MNKHQKTLQEAMDILQSLIKGEPVEELRVCPDCATNPGQPHEEGCDVERCSVCGDQRLGCPCEGHDPAFSRWTGFWPGSIEADRLGIDLNQFYIHGFHEIFFVKPATESQDVTGDIPY